MCITVGVTLVIIDSRHREKKMVTVLNEKPWKVQTVQCDDSLRAPHARCDTSSPSAQFCFP